MSYFSQVPKAVADYTGTQHPHPTIAQEFTDGQGWRTPGWRKRITVSYARTLKRDGVTAVALDLGNGRRADFTVAELIRGGVAS